MKIKQDHESEDACMWLEGELGYTFMDVNGSNEGQAEVLGDCQLADGSEPMDIPALLGVSRREE